jgi:hypothetical protein
MNTKELRKHIDKAIYQLERDLKRDVYDCGTDIQEYCRATALARTKLEEAKMWLGKRLASLEHKLPDEFNDYCDERKELEKTQ